MLYYDGINISEGIDLAKSNNSKECMICYYCFFNHGLEFQDSVCNVCHDFTMLSVNISDIAMITVKNVDYPCLIFKNIFIKIICHVFAYNFISTIVLIHLQIIFVVV